MTTSLSVRNQIVEAFRRDLVGPGPQDEDLARERLNDRPSRWYLTGFLAPVEELDTKEDEADPSLQEEAEIDAAAPDNTGAEAGAGDNPEPEAPNSRRRFLPSSVGLTVLLDPDESEITARISWGDYRTEPPLSEVLLSPEPLPEEVGEDGKPGRGKRPDVEWLRAPKVRTVNLPIIDGRAKPALVVPESAAEQYPGGGLVLETHSRVFNYLRPDGGTERVKALTVFLVNCRAATHRFYADVGYAFQAKLELISERGFRARRDLSAYRSDAADLRIADLHYRDVCEWAVGRNVAAAWHPAEDAAGEVHRVWTEPLPSAEVERVAPNEDEGLKRDVTFSMEDLAARAAEDGSTLAGRCLGCRCTMPSGSRHSEIR